MRSQLWELSEHVLLSEVICSDCIFSGNIGFKTLSVLVAVTCNAPSDGRVLELGSGFLLNDRSTRGATFKHFRDTAFAEQNAHLIIALACLRKAAACCLPCLVTRQATAARKATLTSSTTVASARKVVELAAVVLSMSINLLMFGSNIHNFRIAS